MHPFFLGGDQVMQSHPHRAHIPKAQEFSQTGTKPWCPKDWLCIYLAGFTQHA